MSTLSGNSMITAQTNTTRFVQAIERVGSKATVATKKQDVVQQLSDLIRTNKVKTAAQSSHQLPKKINLNNIFKDLGVQLHKVDDNTEKFRETISNVDLGITKADFAIADSGTLVLVTNIEADRWVSSLPPIYVAILDASQIYPSLKDISSLLRSVSVEGSRKAITLLTGPSRTSDIELTDIIGVHGPHKVHVIIIQE